MRKTHIALIDGRNVPAFFDLYEAEDAGMRMKRDWNKMGRVVPKCAVPSGIVVVEKSRLPISMAKPRMVTPILGQIGDCLVIAERWKDVFNEEQTKERKKTTDNKVNKNNIQNNKKKCKGVSNSALMTPKESEHVPAKELAINASNKAKSKVNNIRAYLPEGLTLPDDCPVKEQIQWFLGLLYWKHLERRLAWDAPIILKYDYLKENIPRWPEVWAWCNNLHLVERTAGYTPGERSYGYWTALPFRDQTHRLREISHPGLAKRIRAIQRRHLARPVLVHLKEQLARLSVDMEQFRSTFSNHPNRRYYAAHLQTIQDGEIRLTRDDFSGRLHSNVSNMYKPLRALLRVDERKETLGETDIKNSQPLFLGIAAKEAGFNDERYLRLCEDGELYEHMANRLGVIRQAAKSEILMMLFAKQGYRSTAKSVFEMDFPSISAFIRKLKRKDHKRPARELQTFERKLLIDTVCERLRRRRPDMFLATIHDSILAQKEDCDLIVNVMHEAFANWGVNPRLNWSDVSMHCPPI